MKNLGLIFSLIALLTVASCSSNKFHTTRIQNIDFTQYRTYGWLSPVDSLSKDYFNNDIARSNIMSTANKEIEARGLTYSKETPDLLFRYVTIVNNKSRLVYSSPYYGGWGGPWGFYRPWGYYGFGYGGFYGGSYPVAKEKVRYGHIILEAIDRKSNSVVWQARGTSQVDVPEKAINELPKMVTGIIKEYPIKLKK